VRTLKALAADPEGGARRAGGEAARLDGIDWSYLLRTIDGLAREGTAIRALSTARAHTWLAEANARCQRGTLRLRPADAALLSRLCRELELLAVLLADAGTSAPAQPQSVRGAAADAEQPRSQPHAQRLSARLAGLGGPTASALPRSSAFVPAL
jgi:hypothetical protein